MLPVQSQGHILTAPRIQQLLPSLHFVRGHLWTQESLTPTQSHLHSHKCHHQCLLGGGWEVGLLGAFLTGIHPFIYFYTNMLCWFIFLSFPGWLIPDMMTTSYVWSSEFMLNLLQIKTNFKSSVPCLYWAYFWYSIFCPGRQSYRECCSRAFKSVSVRILGLQWM